MLEQNKNYILKQYYEQKLLIAIVDDDLIFQFIAERLIESINSEHQTIIFSDGKEAPIISILTV
jgi:hypothetical protein